MLFVYLGSWAVGAVGLLGCWAVWTVGALGCWAVGLLYSSGITKLWSFSSDITTLLWILQKKTRPRQSNLQSPVSWADALFIGPQGLRQKLVLGVVPSHLTQICLKLIIGQLHQVASKTLCPSG